MHGSNDVRGEGCGLGPQPTPPLEQVSLMRAQPTDLCGSLSAPRSWPRARPRQDAAAFPGAFTGPEHDITKRYRLAHDPTATSAPHIIKAAYISGAEGDAPSSAVGFACGYVSNLGQRFL